MEQAALDRAGRGPGRGRPCLRGDVDDDAARRPRPLAVEDVPGRAYLTTISPNVDPVSVGPLHTWTVELKTADGKPVDGASVAINGGMPQHGHGLPTAPQVTRNLGEGRYLVEGMKFNMPGWWTIEVEVGGPAGRDETVFNLVL